MGTIAPPPPNDLGAAMFPTRAVIGFDEQKRAHQAKPAAGRPVSGYLAAAAAGVVPQLFSTGSISFA